MIQRTLWAQLGRAASAGRFGYAQRVFPKL